VYVCLSRGVDPYGTGGTSTSPPIFMKGWGVHGNAPNILEVMSFRLGLFYPVTATTVVCCILMQMLCVVSHKSLSFCGTSPLDRLPELRAWTPLGPPDSQFFMSPNNPVRSTPLCLSVCETVSLCVCLSHKAHALGFTFESGD